MLDKVGVGHATDQCTRAQRLFALEVFDRSMIDLVLEMVRCIHSVCV